MLHPRRLSRRDAIPLIGSAALLTSGRTLSAPRQLCGVVPDAPSGPGPGPSPGTSVCPSTLTPSILGGVATLTGAGIGTADPSRLVVVCIAGWRGLPTSPLSSVTFNGITARFLDLSQVNDTYCSIAWAMVPTGTTINIVASYQSAINQMVMTVCNIVWPNFPNPYVRDAGQINGTSVPLSLGLIMPANGFVYGTFSGVDGTNGAVTWTGATANYNAAAGAQWLSTAAGVGGSSGGNLTVSASNPNTHSSLEAVTIVNASSVTTPVIVQSAINEIGGGQLNATFPGNPTPGNLIVAICAPYALSGANAGWIELLTANAGDTGQAHGIYYRVAQVGDTGYCNPSPGYPGIASVTAIYEIANYDDGNGSSQPWGKGLAAFASQDGITNKPAVASYSDTISSTFPQTLVLGLIQTQGTTVAGVSGATIDHVSATAACFHAPLGVGSVTLVGSGAVASEIVWQTCVIAPRYR